MAESSFTQTGVAELRAAVDGLPDRVTAALRDAARSTAARMKSAADATLRAQQKTAAHALADAITITEDVPNKQVLVSSPAPRGQAANLPIWNEYGTVRMPARPYMRPAAVAEDARYRADCASAAAEAVAEALR